MRNLIYTDLVLRMIANFPGLVAEDFAKIDNTDLVNWLRKEMNQIEKLDPTIGEICEILKRVA